MLNTKYSPGVSCLVIALITGTCFAQNPESSKETSKFFKLDFVIKEVDGAKVLNARTYSTTASVDSLGSSIRTGSKVPVQSAPGSAQFNFIEVGVNIDLRSIKEWRNEVSLLVTAEITSTVQEPVSSTNPVIRQNRWSSTVLVPLKKATVIFSSDDTTTRHQMQMELTATPIT